MSSGTKFDKIEKEAQEEKGYDDKEVLKEMDLDEEGRDKVVEEVLELDKKAEKKVKDEARSSLYTGDYFKNLAEYGQYLLGKIDYNGNWKYSCYPDDRGLVFKLIDPWGRSWMRGMMVYKHADLDIFGVEGMAFSCEDTVDDVEGRLAKEEKKK